ALETGWESRSPPDNHSPKAHPTRGGPLAYPHTSRPRRHRTVLWIAGPLHHTVLWTAGPYTQPRAHLCPGIPVPGAPSSELCQAIPRSPSDSTTAPDHASELCRAIPRSPSDNPPGRSTARDGGRCRPVDTECSSLTTMSGVIDTALESPRDRARTSPDSRPPGGLVTERIRAFEENGAWRVGDDRPDDCPRAFRTQSWTDVVPVLEHSEHWPGIDLVAQALRWETGAVGRGGAPSATGGSGQGATGEASSTSVTTSSSVLDETNASLTRCGRAEP
ncbi:hypothetical protein ABIC85_004009, partial [Oerskovia enterophila]